MTHTRSRHTIGRWTLALLLALLLAACGGGESEQAAATPQEEEAVAEVDTNETEEATESGGPVCLVPDVVGFDQANAERMVQGLGLQPIRTAEFSEDVPEGQVIEQEPAGDTRLDPCEGEVSLVVSLGVEAEPTATATPTAEPTETPTPTAEPTETATPTTEPTATIASTTEPTPAEEAETDEVAPTPDAAPAPPSEEGAANASEAFSIDLEPYEVGDFADELGTDLLIAERDGRKHLAGYTDLGRLELGGLSLSSNFELVFEADWNDFTQNIMLRSNTGEELGIRFEGRHISFGNTELRDYRSNWDGAANLIRLTVNNDTAKLYINDVFFGTTMVDPSLTYSELTISGINRGDALFAVSGTALQPRSAIEPGMVITTSDGRIATNIIPYQIGDIAVDLGTNLMIKERNGQKHITGYTDQGEFRLDNLSLSSNFELVFEADWNDFTQNAILRSSTGEELGIRFEGRHISFGNTELRDYRSNWDGAANLIRLTVNNDTAKLYINEEFFGTASVDPALTYNNFIISGIKRDDALYSVMLIQNE